MRNIFFLLIFFGYGKVISCNLNLVSSNDNSDILNITQYYYNYIHDLFPLNTKETTTNCSQNIEHKIICNLLNAHYNLYSLQRDEVSAYIELLSANDLARSINNESFIFECLHAVIKYSLYTKYRIDDIPDYLNEMSGLHSFKCIPFIVRALELMYKYEKLSSDINFENTLFTKSDLESSFLNSIDELNRNQLYRFESDLRTYCAFAYKSQGYYDLAKHQFEYAIIAANNFSDHYYLSKKLTTTLNLIDLDFKTGNFVKSINSFKELDPNFKNLLPPEDLVYIYDWISACYDSLEIRDSAYYYLKLRDEFDQKTNELNEVQLTSQIKEDRDKSLFNSIIIKLKNYIAWLVVVVIIFSFSMYSFYKYQSVKKKAVESELQTTKVQAAYDATIAKMEGEQQERQEIASVLHDQIASLLTAADMQLSVAAKKGDQANQEFVNKAGDIIKDVNSQVRNLSHKLVSPALLKFGLGAGLDSLIEKMSTPQVAIALDSEIDNERFLQSKETFLYNTTAELIQNVLKHSNASNALVKLNRTDEFLQLSIADNGTNADLNSESLGLGLTHIRNKAEALGGSFVFNKNESGVGVVVSIPI